MATYTQYFFEHNGQILSVLGVSIIWIGFTALGAASSNEGRLRALDPIVGWAWVGLAFTALGVFSSVPLSMLSLLAGFLAISAAIFVWRRDGRLLPSGFLRLLILILPLLILVSAMQASQWDEFPHWLLIPRYMLETNALPSKVNPYPNAYLTAYPFSWHLITYLTSHVAGRLIENAGALTNVLLLLTFGLIVIQLIARGAGKPEKVLSSSWSIIALGGVAMFLANPTFAQKVVLTSYADTSSAVTTGSAVVLGWLICEALRDNEQETAKIFAWQMGAVLALLINLKQATMVLVVLVLLATIITAIRDRKTPINLFLWQIPRIVLPGLVLYLIWRYHVTHELVGRELSLRPFENWFFSLSPEILIKMFTVLLKKGYYLALVMIAVYFGVRGLIRSESPFDRFALIVALVVIGYNVFLFFAYLASFGKEDALRAASYWRYNMHLGPTLIAFTAYGAALVWRRYLESRWSWKYVKWLPIILVIAAPLIFAHKIRFDKTPKIVHFRTVGAALPNLLTVDDKYFICDPNGSGESSVIVGYELGHSAKFAGALSAFTQNRLDTLKKAMARPELNTIIIFSINTGFEEVIGRRLTSGSTYLLKRENLGPWRNIKSWPQSEIK